MNTTYTKWLQNLHICMKTLLNRCLSTTLIKDHPDVVIPSLGDYYIITTKFSKKAGGKYFTHLTKTEGI